MRLTGAAHVVDELNLTIFPVIAGWRRGHLLGGQEGSAG
jgi:hypothetical protein